MFYGIEKIKVYNTCWYLPIRRKKQEIKATNVECISVVYVVGFILLVAYGNLSFVVANVAKVFPLKFNVNWWCSNFRFLSNASGDFAYLVVVSPSTNLLIHM